MSKTRIVLEFPTQDAADAFCAWFADGGGESGFFDCGEEDDDPVVRCDYSKCFPAWGYNPKKHGDRTIVFQRAGDIKKKKKGKK